MLEEKKKTTLMRKLIYVALLLFVVALSFFSWVVYEKVLPKPKVHYHAGFIVIKNNKLEDFSSLKYQNFEPCKADPNEKEEATPEQEQLEKAHLHDYVGDVVHVESNSSKWSDLFTNLKYPINYSEVTAYSNGIEVKSFQNRKIKPYESIVILVGTNKNKEQFLSKAVSIQHIKDAEKKSENCGM